MSWWPFGKTPAAPVAPDELESMDKLLAAVQTLQLQKLTKMQQVEAATAKYESQAKKAFDKGQTTQAKELLKKAKALQLPIRQLDAQIANLEHTIDLVNSTATSTQMASALKTGATTMQHMVKTVNVDDVANIREDLEEAVAATNELNDILATPLGTQGEIESDEEEADQLAEWERQREAQMLAQLMPTVKNDNNNGGGGQAVPVEKQQVALKK